MEDVLSEVEQVEQSEKKSQTRTPKEESIPKYIALVHGGVNLEGIAYQLGVQKQSVKNLVISTEEKWQGTAKVYRKEIARRESLFTEENFPIQGENETEEDFNSRVEKYQSEVEKNDEVVEQLTESAEKLENTKLPRPKDWNSGKRGRRSVSPVALCNIALKAMEIVNAE